MKSSNLLSLTTIMVFCFSIAASFTGPWTLLGSCKVNGRADYDEIVVTGSQGDFKAIKLFVQNEGIDFDRVVVHYGNGSTDRIDIRNFVPAGGETRVIDLAGGDRVIRKVVFYYKSNPSTAKKGKVLLYGRR
ncbi:MAG: hypothetical protein SH808_04580 [Saprospiraceae bacterium]|nr:hypothetical protein [Saprospiraceae bacterium]